MANLVPLHIDKDTGNLVAKPINPGNTPASSAGNQGFLYSQFAPVTTWIVPHKGGNSNLICQVYDPTGLLIFPDGIRIIDINTIQITFGAPQSGKAHIMFFDVN